MYLLLFFVYTLSYCPVDTEFDLKDYHGVKQSTTTTYPDDVYTGDFSGKWLGYTMSPKPQEKNHELKRSHVVGTHLLRQSADKTNS